MSNVRIELNSEGVKQLLKSPEMEGICRNLAEGIASSAAGNYEVSTYSGRNRVNASVYTADRETLQENLDGNALLKALGGAR